MNTTAIPLISVTLVLTAKLSNESVVALDTCLEHTFSKNVIMPLPVLGMTVVLREISQPLTVEKIVWKEGSECLTVFLSKLSQVESLWLYNNYHKIGLAHFSFQRQ